MKRVFNLLAAVLLLGLLCLPLAVLVLLQLCLMGRPVFFRQERAGLEGRPFFVLKFRTMREGPGSDDQRLTAWGRLLRSTSLDELPELWNVLKGEMSLVGPRPLPVAYLPRYSKQQARRHEVLPGITGWAQVNGWRGETDASEKMQKRVEHDLWYIEHWSFWLDMKIIFITIFRAWSSPNAY